MLNRISLNVVFGIDFYQVMYMSNLQKIEKNNARFDLSQLELVKGDTDYDSMWVATTDSTIKNWVCSQELQILVLLF